MYYSAYRDCVQSILVAQKYGNHNSAHIYAFINLN